MEKHSGYELCWFCRIISEECINYIRLLPKVVPCDRQHAACHSLFFLTMEKISCSLQMKIKNLWTSFCEVSAFRLSIMFLSNMWLLWMKEEQTKDEPKQVAEGSYIKKEPNFLWNLLPEVAFLPLFYLFINVKDYRKNNDKKIGISIWRMHCVSAELIWDGVCNAVLITDVWNPSSELEKGLMSCTSIWNSLGATSS